MMHAHRLLLFFYGDSGVVSVGNVCPIRGS